MGDRRRTPRLHPRAGRMDLSYFGNCLTNLEHYNGQDTNYYTVYPIDDDAFFDTLDGEVLKTDTRFWRVRGQNLALTRRKEEYAAAGVELKQYEPGEIRAEEAARWLVPQHRNLFRATDPELYKSLPTGLPKILTLDEWYHRDYIEIPQLPPIDERLRAAYELSRHLSQNQPQNQPFMDFDTFAKSYRSQQQTNDAYDREQHDTTRPSAYETWPLIAKVIATGDPSAYQPTMPPNTHWAFWPDSGSL